MPHHWRALLSFFYTSFQQLCYQPELTKHCSNNFSPKNGYFIYATSHNNLLTFIDEIRYEKIRTQPAYLAINQFLIKFSSKKICSHAGENFPAYVKQNVKMMMVHHLPSHALVTTYFHLWEVMDNTFATQLE